MNPCGNAYPLRPSTFQSSPGIAAGRIVTPLDWTTSLECFNPRPASLPGESRWHPPVQLPCGCFNPRPASLPGESWGRLRAGLVGNGFNPRPASLPGESTNVRCEAYAGAVSIHARHRCRANQFPGSSLSVNPVVSIHAWHRCRANPDAQPCNCSIV